jgi:arginase family enzyme
LHLQILEIDGSTTTQASLAGAAPWDSVSTIDLRDIAPRLRLWSRAETIAELRRRLDAANAKSLGAITLLGSGDFHHLAAVLIERATKNAPQPFTLVHIDNHPDWVRLAPRWHCGSWINRVLELPNVARVITLGVCSDDLVRPDLKGGNLPALSSGRLALFPWSRPPSRVWTRVSDGAGHRYENGWIVWDNLAEGRFEAHLDAVLAQIGTDAVWITIDKDVLPEAEAFSNWDQGQMPLARVIETIRFIGSRKRVLGADICGEYSPIEHTNWLKRFESRRDQPHRHVGAAALARNEQVNVELLRALAGVQKEPEHVESDRSGSDHIERDHTGQDQGRQSRPGQGRAEQGPA